jgi:RNA polymerase sigma-70 factor (ECF subfamily)
LHVRNAGTISSRDARQDSLYEEVAAAYAAALDRLARAYESDAEARRDLLQEIHLQVWRSLALFDQRCSLRTWVYRVAHNIATKHVMRRRRIAARLVSIEEADAMPATGAEDARAGKFQALERLGLLIRRLKPLDRQIIVCYLEGMDAASIAEITGLSPPNIAVKIHRIKATLKRWFGDGGPHAE